MNLQEIYNQYGSEIESENKSLFNILVKLKDRTDIETVLQTEHGQKFLKLLEGYIHDKSQQRNISTGTLGAGKPIETSTGSTGTIQYSANTEHVGNEHNNLEPERVEYQSIRLDFGRNSIQEIQVGQLQNNLVPTASNVGIQSNEAAKVGAQVVDSSARLAQREAFRNQLPDIKHGFEKILCGGRLEFIEAYSYIRTNYGYPFKITALRALQNELSGQFPILSPSSWGTFLKDIEKMDAYFELLTDKMD